MSVRPRPWLMPTLTHRSRWTALTVLVAATLAGALIATAVTARSEPLIEAFSVRNGSVRADGPQLTGEGTVRAPTRDSYPPNIRIAVTLAVEDWSESDPPDWHGVDVWARYQSEFDLYAIQLLRPDQMIVVSKKVPNLDNPANNFGEYYNLAVGRFAWELGTAYEFTVEVTNDGEDVRFAVAVDGEEILTALDDGVGGDAITAEGRSGWRTDGVRARVEDFTVEPL